MENCCNYTNVFYYIVAAEKQILFYIIKLSLQMGLKEICVAEIMAFHLISCCPDNNISLDTEPTLLKSLVAGEYSS